MCRAAIVNWASKDNLLCKVAANERNENLFSDCRVQHNLCKVTTFFSLIGVTLCLCCFLAQNAYVLSLPSHVGLFCMVLIETHASSFSFLHWDKVTISFVAAWNIILLSF